MSLEALLTWLATHANLIGQLGGAALLAGLLGLALWRDSRREREHARAVERRLSLVEEENRDCHAVLTAGLSVMAEQLTLLRHLSEQPLQPLELREIENKVAEIREQLRTNKAKYESWARDEAKRRDRA